VTLPATDAIAVALPQAIALAIMKSTLGPGAKIMIIAAMRYSGYLAGKVRSIRALSMSLWAFLRQAGAQGLQGEPLYS
jgi:hypothetical protein